MYCPRLCMQDSRKTLKYSIKKRRRKGKGGRKKSNPITGLHRPQGFQKVEALRF